MTHPALEDILAQCLDDMRHGRATLAECLARYPEQRAELEPLLRAALWVSQADAARPDPAFRAAAKTRLLNRIRAEQTRSRAVSPGPISVTSGFLHRLWGWTRKFQPQQPRRRSAMIWALVLAAIALVAGGGGVAYASTDALPDDVLYPVKLAVEEAQLLFADAEEDVQLHLEFAQRRLEEAQVMAQQGQTYGLERALANYEAHLQAALRLAQQVGQADPQVWAEVARQVERHQERLQELAQETHQQGLTEAEQQMLQAQERVRQTLEHAHRVMGQETPEGDMPTPPFGPQGPMPTDTMPVMPGGQGHGEGRGQGNGDMNGGQGEGHATGQGQGNMGGNGQGQGYMGGEGTFTPEPGMTPTEMPFPMPTMPGGNHNQGGMGGGHDG